MRLADATWQDVRDLSRDTVVLVPTGSLEQHGPHLPLFTDTVLATAVSEAVAERLSDRVLLTPTLWLGASSHHLRFPGTLSASFEAYASALESVVESLVPHGFWKFYVVNGHGGNTESNGLACRALRDRHPELLIGHSGYFSFLPQALLDEVMTGPVKGIRHACEAEASLMMHVAPGLVRQDRCRDDGLAPNPPVPGLVFRFDEITEEGSLGYATLATADKGRRLFEAAVEGCSAAVAALADGVALEGPL
jgi:creatinine amidohydrolase